MGLATTLWAAGTAATIGGQLYAAEQAAQAQEYNAQIAEQQAEVERQHANIEAARQRRDTQKLLSTQRARYGASGVAFTGSPLEVLSETAEDAEYDALLTEWVGRMRGGYYDAEAGMRRRSARSERIGSYIGAGTTFLSSVGNLALAGGIGSGTTKSAKSAFSVYKGSPMGMVRYT